MEWWDERGRWTRPNEVDASWDRVLRLLTGVRVVFFGEDDYGSAEMHPVSEEPSHLAPLLDPREARRPAAEARRTLASWRGGRAAITKWNTSVPRGCIRRPVGEPTKDLGLTRREGGLEWDAAEGRIHDTRDKDTGSRIQDTGPGCPSKKVDTCIPASATLNLTAIFTHLHPYSICCSRPSPALDDERTLHRSVRASRPTGNEQHPLPTILVTSHSRRIAYASISHAAIICGCYAASSHCRP